MKENCFSIKSILTIVCIIAEIVGFNCEIVMIAQIFRHTDRYPIKKFYHGNFKLKIESYFKRCF